MEHDWSTESPDDGLAPCARCPAWRGRPIRPGAAYRYAAVLGGEWHEEPPPCDPGARIAVERGLERLTCVGCRAVVVVGAVADPRRGPWVALHQKCREAG